MNYIKRITKYDCYWRTELNRWLIKFISNIWEKIKLLIIDFTEKHIWFIQTCCLKVNILEEKNTSSGKSADRLRWLILNIGIIHLRKKVKQNKNYLLYWIYIWMSGQIWNKTKTSILILFINVCFYLVEIYFVLSKRLLAFQLFVLLSFKMIRCRFLTINSRSIPSQNLIESWNFFLHHFLWLHLILTVTLWFLFKFWSINIHLKNINITLCFICLAVWHQWLEKTRQKKDCVNVH